MSLLRNFSPGGSPEDDGQPTTAERMDEAAPPAGGAAPGAARYAFAAPAAATGEETAPVPGTVISSEVVTEPDAAQERDLAEQDPAGQAAPGPVAEATDPETTWPAPAPEVTASPALETPVPTWTPLPAAETTPAPAFEDTPTPVPSPRATGAGGEDEAAVQPTFVPAPDLAGPLISDAAELSARWQRVQGDFVDDPQAAVSDAADLVGQTAEALVGALRQRQRELRAAWERGAADGSAAAADGQSPAAMASGGPDTEHLRLMMQRYRALFNQLCRPSQP